MSEIDLLMTIGAGLSFIGGGGTIAGIVDAGIPPAKDEIACVTRGQFDALFGIAGHECRAMIDDVGLAEPRIIDNDLIEHSVVIETVDMNPVAGHAATEVRIHLPWVVSDNAIVS